MGYVAVLYWNMDPKDMENIIRQKRWIWLYMEHRFEVLDSQFYLFLYLTTVMVTLRSLQLQ